MDPDFATLEFPRFKREDDVTEQKTKDGQPAPAQAAAPPVAAGIPWIGSLMGGIPALDLPDEDEVPAATTETPKGDAPKGDPAPAKGDKPKGSGVTVNVFPGAKAKPGKAKAKPAAPAKGDEK